MPKLLMCPQVIEIETPNLVSIETVLCVPNFTTFPQVVLWAAIDFQSRRRIIKKTNRYNRRPSTFNAWPLIT